MKLFTTVWHFCLSYIEMKSGQCQTEKLEEKTESPPAQDPLECKTKLALCGTLWGGKKQLFCGSDCFGLLLIAVKWQALYNPGLRVKSLLEHLHWHFKDGSGAGQATHPSNKLTIMQCELINQWPWREKWAQAPFWWAVERWNWVHTALSWLTLVLGSTSDLSWLSAAWTKCITQQKQLNRCPLLYYNYK